MKNNGVKKKFAIINRTVKLLGFDPGRMITTFLRLPQYFRDLAAFKNQQKVSSGKIPIQNLYPCLNDRFVESGVIHGHYFYQDWYVANRIFKNKPRVHVDVGSRIDGFVTHVAAFRPIRVMDIRPLEVNIPNIDFIQANLLEDIKEDLIGCCDSLSCLHSLEHFGLGRYGDPVDYYGHIKGFNNLSKLLTPKGTLYLSVPIGPQRVEFNAHRIFSVEYLLELISQEFRITRFSYIDSDNSYGKFYENMELTTERITTNFGCSYGCGIFEASKR